MPMSPRTKLLLIPAALLISLCGLIWLAWPGGPSGPPKHVLFIVVDALRADALSLHGHPQETSPWLERFARKAVVFERARAQGTYTQASYWSYMTSSHLRSTGWDFPVPGPLPRGGFCQRTDLRTLPEVLSEQGFVTSAVVTNGFLRSRMGFPRGFQVWNQLPVDKMETLEINDEKHKGVQLVNWAKQDMDGWDDGRRHFLYVHAMQPHLPGKPGKKARELFSLDPEKEIPVSLARELEGDGDPEAWQELREFYLAEVWEADRALQRLLEGLRERGLLRDTLVIISADHGERMFEHDGQYGHKFGVWQELAWVPLLLRWPGLEPARYQHPVALVDIAPTTLSVLGLEHAIPRGWQGRDALGLERSQAAYPVVTERLGELAITLDGRFSAIRDAQGGWRLYDLVEDPGEQRAIDDPERLALLQEAYRRWLRDTPEGVLDTELEPVGMCRFGVEPLDKGVEEELRALGYME